MWWSMPEGRGEYRLLENQGLNPQDIGRDAYTFRSAAENVFQHIHNHLDDKYGTTPYDIQAYGTHIAGGYRYDDYSKAMEAVGEYW